MLAAGCSDPGLSPIEAAELAEPHLDHFETFERWARRAVSADPAFRSRDSLEETVFAPVRNTEGIAGIWIERQAVHARALSFGALGQPPKGVAWVRVRNPSRGDIDVSTAKVPSAARTRRSGDAAPCVLLRRARPGPDGAEVRLTIAYLRPEP